LARPPAEELSPPIGLPPSFDVDDEDSEDCATVMMDTAGTDLSAAIADALQARGRPPTSPQASPAQPAAAQPPAMGQPPRWPKASPEPARSSEVSLVLAGAVPTAKPSAPAVAPPPQMATPVPGMQLDGLPMAPRRRGGLRTALIVSSVVLVMVVFAVALLFMDRRGVIDLGLGI